MCTKLGLGIARRGSADSSFSLGWSKYTGDKFERGVSPYAEGIWKSFAIILFFFSSLFESPYESERFDLSAYPRDQKVMVKVLIGDV